MNKVDESMRSAATSNIALVLQDLHGWRLWRRKWSQFNALNDHFCYANLIVIWEEHDGRLRAPHIGHEDAHVRVPPIFFC